MCIKLYENSKTFRNATRFCKRKGARLAILNTEEQLSYVVDNYLNTIYKGILFFILNLTS